MQKVPIKLSVFFANSKFFFAFFTQECKKETVLSISLVIIYVFLNCYVLFMHQVLAWTHFYKYSYKLHVKDCFEHHSGIILGYSNNKENDYCKRKAKPRQQRNVHSNFANLTCTSNLNYISHFHCVLFLICEY